MTDVVRVVHSPDGSWLVMEIAGQRSNDFVFKKRFCAEAFGRAVAQRANKQLMVLGQDGVSRLKPDVSLTYGAALE